MRTATTLTAVALVALAAGCGSLVPVERSRSQSVQATESLAVEQERTIRRMLEVTPAAAAPPAASSPKGPAPVAQPLREELSYTTSTRTGAGSAQLASGQDRSSIPLGVKLVLLAAGVASLVGALLLAWRYAKATAAGQALALADDVLAQRVRALRAESATSTDQQAIARVQAQVAELEAERGRLRTRMR